MTRTERIEQKKAQQARMEAARQITRNAVALNSCPVCGAKVRRNNALTGWIQCEQFGSEAFRKYPQEASCDWQGFTE